MDYSLPGSSVHGIFQARILVWVPISFSKGSSWSRDQTHISCLAGGFFTTAPPGKPPKNHYNIANGWKVPWLSHHIASEDCPGSSGQRFPISLTWNWGFDVRVFKRCWDFPGSPVVKTLPSNVPGVGLVPGQGAKIPHALRPKKPKIKQKQYWNKFNNDFKNDPHKRKVSKKLLLCTC